MSLLSTFISRAARRFVGLVFALAIGVCGSAAAQGAIEKLVAPGELSRAHETSDAACKSCHASFDKNAQNRMCLECHKDVATDIGTGVGFHGRDPKVKNAPCKTCHSEHHGADFDIAAFDAPSFDHKLTDYPLAGAHVKIECAACHRPDRKYREAPTNCFSCHGDDDPHRGELGQACQTCHNVAGWKDIRFDHARTKFPLLGAHKAATCGACHVNGKYKGVATDCVSCHREDDAHKGAFGAACADCHNEQSWKSQTFNHAAKTGFALLGGHASIECAACHTKSLTEPKLSRDCFSCHRKDDTHKGRNGARCADCHSESSWKSVRFDHNKTKFPLRGAHAKVLCASCHVDPVDKAMPGRTCIDCHRKDDVHKGGQGEACATCHNESSWTGKVNFDHDLYDFPLLGKHKTVACGECHLTQEYKETPSDCAACHRDDDVHKGALGPSCANCHNPAGWPFWKFDHDMQTSFPLTGAHGGLACASCHQARADNGVDQSSSCIACHRADDKHRGQFGAACDRCHTTESFKDIKLR